MATCALDRGRFQRPAQNRSRLCHWHDQRLREDLTDIGVLFPLLGELREAPGQIGAVGERYTKRIDPPPPLPLDVVVLLDVRTKMDPRNPTAISVPTVLAGWSCLVRAGLKLAPPPRHSIDVDLALLITHHDYAVAQEWVDDYGRETHLAAQGLRHACGEYDPPPLGQCPILVDGEPCGGPLFPDRYGLMAVRCAKCGETWGEDSLRRLGLVLAS